jgi:hypothetical protein
MSSPTSPWTPGEARVLRRLRTPEKLQRFLDEEVAYNIEPDGPTCSSPRLALRHMRAHCMEGAMLAAAALRFHGAPPLLVDLEAERDDDHVLAVYRSHGCWGAVAKSNYAGLRFRAPVYRTVRELVMSYFDDYFNLQGERSLRAHSRPVNLKRFDRQHWMTSEDPVWFVPEHLCVIPHVRVVTGPQARRLTRLDRRSFEAGCLGRVAH